MSYTYDLELSQENGQLIPTGGEWHENVPPDYLWIPQQGSIARRHYDEVKLEVDLEKEPKPQTTTVAQVASRAGYPLCQVLEKLVNTASGTSDYRCQE